MAENIKNDRYDDIVRLTEAAITSGRDFGEIKGLLDEIRKLAPPAQNRWNFRYVIWAIGLVAIASPFAFMIVGIAGDGKFAVEIPAELIALSSTAVGALAAYLTSSSVSED